MMEVRKGLPGSPTSITTWKPHGNAQIRKRRSWQNMPQGEKAETQTMWKLFTIKNRINENKKAGIKS